MPQLQKGVFAANAGGGVPELRFSQGRTRSLRRSSLSHDVNSLQAPAYSLASSPSARAGASLLLAKDWPFPNAGGALQWWCRIKAVQPRAKVSLPLPPLARTASRVPLTRSFIRKNAGARRFCLQVHHENADRIFRGTQGNPKAPAAITLSPPPSKVSGGLFSVPKQSFSLAIPVAEVVESRLRHGGSQVDGPLCLGGAGLHECAGRRRSREEQPGLFQGPRGKGSLNLLSPLLASRGLIADSENRVGALAVVRGRRFPAKPRRLFRVLTRPYTSFLRCTGRGPTVVSYSCKQCLLPSAFSPDEVGTIQMQRTDIVLLPMVVPARKRASSGPAWYPP